MSDSQIQVYSIYINAPAKKVWDAITTSEYTTQWGYGGETEYDLTPGGDYRNLTTDEMKQMGMGDVAVSGTVVEVEEPTRLVLDWSPAWHPESNPTRLTWELTEFPSGLTRVVLTHDLTAAPEYAAEVAGGGEPAQGGGGWPWCLSGLKTLLETGKSMGA
ncbi:SRPBCC domain-containing protein [Demetria terragena]|uniref:SRPBCC domain-containing protein n=1 Tax=Demetria terragena TaxID=63959 RepID=UPI0003637319|nr:SRPBCC domain-containing protein [Demetria terragena]